MTDNEPHEEPEKKKRGRKKVGFYTPTDEHLCFFRLFLNDIYRAKYCLDCDYSQGLVRSYPACEKSDRSNELSTNTLVMFEPKTLGFNPEDVLFTRFQYSIYLGNENNENAPVSDNYPRGLTTKEIINYVLEKYPSVFKIENPDTIPKRRKEEIYSSFKKTLDTFCQEKGFLVKCDPAVRKYNKKLYYPNESPDAFRRFLGMLHTVMKDDCWNRYSFLFKSEYFKRCLNKKFVLDTIVGDAQPGYYLYSSQNYKLDPCFYEQFGIDADRLPPDTNYVNLIITLPLAGRYPKKYEDSRTGILFKKFIKKVEDYFLSLNTIVRGQLEYHFFGQEIKVDPDSTAKQPPPKLSDESKEDIKKVIEKICRDLDYDSRIKNKLSDRLTTYEDSLKYDYFDGDATKVREIFDADPDGTYREEDPWIHVDLEDENIKNLILDGSEINCLRLYPNRTTAPVEYDPTTHQIKSPTIETVEIPVEKKRYDDLIEDYYETIDTVILPILSLIQFSPNALLYFVCERDEWSKEYIKSDNGHDYFNHNALTDLLIKKAIRDYFNGMTIENAGYPTRCIHIGNHLGENANYPSVMTFMLGEKQRLDIAWSEDVYESYHDGGPKFHPYFEKHPCYSQRILDIVKMSAPRGAGHILKEFLISALVEHPDEWKKLVE